APARVGAWSSRPLPLSASELRILGTEDVLRRRYRRPADPAPVEVLLVHSASAARGLHPPDVCYSLQGFVERWRRPATLRTRAGPVPVTLARVRLGGAEHLVASSFRVGGAYRRTFEGARWVRLLRRGLLLGGEPGSTVRLSTPIVAGEAAALARLEAFSAEALADLLAPLP
ncbi:MAG: EpsI family protein, partial [Planctomycetota bacterium]